MRRGTTPTLLFELPFKASDIEVLDIVFVQNGNILMEKTLDDVQIDENRITLELTQAETLLFDADLKRADVQLRCKIGSRYIASDIQTMAVSGILKDGELV